MVRLFNSKKEIDNCGLYCNTGMMAVFVGASYNCGKENNLIEIQFDYSGFEAQNVLLEQKNHYDDKGNPSLSSREVYGYFETEEHCFDGGLVVEDYFDFVHESASKK